MKSILATKTILPRLALVFGLAVCGPAMAQPAPDPATLKIARDVVVKMQGDRTALLSQMTAPMVGLVQQMGVTDPQKAQVLVRDVVVPTMAAHFDELLDTQARSYASVLSASDLGAISSFYDTPAGRSLAANQPKLAQAQMTGMTQWMGGIMPDLQAKLATAMKAQAGPPAKTRP